MKTTSCGGWGMVAVALAVLGACGSEGPEKINNDPEPELFEGGGTGGGAIDGRLNVYVVDRDSGKGIAGAYVMLGQGPDPEFSGTTDPAGLIAFRTADVVGPLTLTVCKESYEAATMAGLNAANVTVQLAPVVPVSCGSATVRGKVTGLDLLPKGNVADGFGAAFVLYSMPPQTSTLECENIEQPAPEGELPPYVVAPALNKETFEVQTRDGQVALYLFGGIIKPKGRGEEPDIKLTHFGLLPGIELKNGEVREGVEIAVDQLLTENAELKLDALPAGTDAFQAMVLLDLGDDGLAPMFAATTEEAEMKTTYKLPKLEGPLLGKSFTIVVRAVKQVDCPEGQECEETQSSMAIEHNLTPQDLSSKWVKDLLPVPTDLIADRASRTLTFKADGSFDFIGSNVEDEEGGSIWSFIQLEAPFGSVALPQAPAEAKCPALPDHLTWSVSLVKMLDGFDPNNYKGFDTLMLAITGMAGNEVTLSK